MPDPISFTSASPRFGLPFLFAGQAQKEFFVNEALARLDALLHPSVLGESGSPPASPQDGDCWIVGSSPTDEWIDHAGDLACRQSGNWLFAEPQTGMRVHDIAAGQDAFFDGGWTRVPAIAAPSGGATQDVEARSAITALIAALVSAGILA